LAISPPFGDFEADPLFTIVSLWASVIGCTSGFSSLARLGDAGVTLAIFIGFNALKFSIS